MGDRVNRVINGDERVQYRKTGNTPEAYAIVFRVSWKLHGSLRFLGISGVAGCPSVPARMKICCYYK
ncbi:MAG: hypothetical protein AMS27_10975 [Bacteroides sp. SM23_62_1]|nr:MAG: hypothetical protein AMS27_10975 [Bacteroides sp. SM23_62_1]